MEQHEIDAMRAFIKTARRGGHGASTGERSAYKLASMAGEISALMQDLDDDRKKGFCHLLCGLAWPDGREALLKLLPQNETRKQKPLRENRMEVEP